MPNALSKRFWMVLLTSLIGVLAVIYISLTNGTFDITIVEVLQTLFRTNPVREYDVLIFEFRLPRIVIAALVGLGLGIVGAVLQGITRNGLADPGILGINAGAGAAVVIFMLIFQGQVSGNGWMSVMTMPLFGMVGGLMAAILIYAFSWNNGTLDAQRLILVGIAIGSGFGALSLYVSLKMNPQDYEMATVWFLGSIWNANWQFIVSILPWLIIFIPIILTKSHVLDLFQLGETKAKSLGVSVEKEKSILLISSIGIVCACVSVSGSIGFVGLISAHISRRLVGMYHKHILPVCGVVGMFLVVLSDFIAKTVFSPVELPVGIVISIIGVPYFLYLLFKATY
ncbi:iron complex transport system permease protein [Salibacterium salarium]|uniref:FecCD family ABC transporter permease n=1 Tax=Salibacterium salarium TaxID=284579 RepID=UPI00277F5D1A|nr:iron ABC transporter permease [Salibacterium salarium]MDQ0297935.1 iron complex transport system permease protein [Salibacterium salarium]